MVRVLPGGLEPNHSLSGDLQGYDEGNSSRVSSHLSTIEAWPNMVVCVRVRDRLKTLVLPASS